MLYMGGADSIPPGRGKGVDDYTTRRQISYGE